MKLLSNIIKKVIMLIIIFSILITFFSTPFSYAKLDLKEGEFYYSGTTKGTYVPKEGIFEWLLKTIGAIADWLLGIMTLSYRMVFVGWTALIEKLLTWSLEATSEVKVDGSIIDNSNDLSNINDSSNNLTVEAIVYNRVPALNVDIFTLSLDKSFSGTGAKIVCKKCGEPSSECVTLNEATAKTIDINNLSGNEICSCGCNGCDECLKYVQQLASEEPIIIIIRKAIATWYYLIRLLTIAAMLIALIAIGIKMAISTIASDKATYKRMLTDWLVGIIIVFTIHYFMIAAIRITNVLVDLISNTSNTISSSSLKDKKVSSSETELKIYEEVRTRAYDPRLTNGMVGMVMYIALVFMAIKYTIIYLKRLLTIIVLTLMAPAIGVAYALQKVLTGKSAALATWVREYIMNLLIQVIHALLYAIFITQALMLSLESIAGMIIALVLMNYVSKADKLFKKIFHFGGENSLVGDTENAQDALKENIKTAASVAIGGKAAAKALIKSPPGKALGAAGKATFAAAYAITSKIKNKDTDERKAGKKFEKAVRKRMDKKYGGSEFKLKEDGSNAETVEQYEDRRAKAEADVKAKEEETQLVEQKLQEKRDEAKKEYEANRTIENKRKYDEAQDAYIAFISPTNKDIMLGKLNKALNANVFKLSKNKSMLKNILAIYNGTFGSTVWNNRTMRFEKQKDAAYNQFSFLLGSKEDRESFKKSWSMVKNTCLGMVSMFVGMGTIATHPIIGMGLLANGKSNVHASVGKINGARTYKGKYTFARYGIQALNNIRDSAIEQARKERRRIKLAAFQKTHPRWIAKLYSGALKVADLGSAPVRYIASKTVVGDRLREIDENTIQRQRREEKEFREETILEESSVANAEIYGVEERIELDSRKELVKDLEESEIEQKQKNQILAFLGLQIDPKTGSIVPLSEQEESDDIKESDNSSKLTDEDIVLENTTGEEHQKISNVDINFINDKLDDIMIDITESTDGTINFNSSKIESEISRRLGNFLYREGILKRNQNPEELFRNGKSGFKKAIKKKAVDLDKIKRKKSVGEVTPPEGEAEPALENSEKPKDINDVIDKLNSESQETVRKAVEKYSRKDKLEKIKQAVSLGLLETEENTQTETKKSKNSNDVITRLLESKKDGESSITLSETEADIARDMLKKLLKYKDENLEIANNPPERSASKAYLKAIQEHSQISEEMLELQKQLIDSDDSTIRLEIKNRMQQLEKISQLISRQGPVFDIDEYLKQSNGRR